MSQCVERAERVRMGGRVGAWTHRLGTGVRALRACHSSASSAAAPALHQTFCDHYTPDHHPTAHPALACSQPRWR